MEKTGHLYFGPTPALTRSADGQPYEIGGTGGSWFRYQGNYQWAWQRDFFDHINAGQVFKLMAKQGKLTPKMIERLQKAPQMPG